MECIKDLVGSGSDSDIFSPTLSNKTGITFTQIDDGYYNIDVSGKNFSFKGTYYSYLSILILVFINF